MVLSYQSEVEQLIDQSPELKLSSLSLAKIIREGGGKK
jgi:hypothetical protein